MAIYFPRLLSFPTLTKRLFTKSSWFFFKVGDEAELRRVISVEDVARFADLTGDTNPIHLNDEFVKKTSFGRLIVHGVILNGILNIYIVDSTLEKKTVNGSCFSPYPNRLISAVHGTKLPGAGCLIVSQIFKYPAPLFPGEEVSAHVRVVSLRHSIMTCQVTCMALQRSKVVLTGETKLLVPQKSVE